MLEVYRYRLILPVLCFLLAFAKTTHALPEQEIRRIEATLEAHGVTPTISNLTAFLEKGWAVSSTPLKLPEVPLSKSSLLIDTWQLLALHYKDVQASPVLSFRLSDLARRYALGQFPFAIVQIIDADAERTEAILRDAKRKEIKDFLQYNGMVALGLFGKPSSDLLRDARSVYAAESRPIIQVAYAQTLILMGDTAALDDLVNEVAKANSGSSVVAAQALSRLLNQSFGITPFTAAAPRKEKAEQLQQWWKEHSGNVHVDREAAILRQLQPPPARPYPQRSINDLLRASADKMDVKDERGSRTAWTKLKEMADKDPKGFQKALEPIIKDQREDLDIRDQAVRWDVQIQGKKAKGILKRLRKDPNPEIAEMAKELLETIRK